MARVVPMAGKVSMSLKGTLLAQGDILCPGWRLGGRRGVTPGVEIETHAKRWWEAKEQVGSVIIAGECTRASRPASSINGPIEASNERTWYAGQCRRTNGSPIAMQALKAQVRNGRLLVDEPTDLPEGEVVELVPLGEVLLNGGDHLDDEERAALHLELQASVSEAEAGELDDFEVALAELPSPR